MSSASSSSSITEKRGIPTAEIVEDVQRGYETSKIVDSIQDRGINQVYIIGGDGTKKGASVIYELIAVYWHLLHPNSCLPRFAGRDLNISLRVCLFRNILPVTIAWIKGVGPTIWSLAIIYFIYVVPGAYVMWRHQNGQIHQAITEGIRDI
ncbi:hypothetical protein ACFE04_025527 [Oxalis oulophora]